MIKVIIFAPTDDFVQSSPRGFTFVDGVFNGARLRDPVSKVQSSTAQLRRSLGYLLRRYPGRLNVQWVNPWTMSGLLFSLRFRVRVFPSALLQSQEQRQILTGDDLSNIGNQIAELLSKPPD